jgi:hypothetical protein
MRFLTALIFTFLVTPAFAGLTTLSTPAVAVNTSNAISCNITNTSTTKSLDVTISLHGQSGSLENSSTATLMPGETTGQATVNISGLVRCVFTFPGSSKLVRAAMEIDNGTDVQLVLAPAN